MPGVIAPGLWILQTHVWRSWAGCEGPLEFAAPLVPEAAGVWRGGSHLRSGGRRPAGGSEGSGNRAPDPTPVTIPCRMAALPPECSSAATRAAMHSNSRGQRARAQGWPQQAARWRQRVARGRLGGRQLEPACPGLRPAVGGRAGGGGGSACGRARPSPSCRRAGARRRRTLPARQRGGARPGALAPALPPVLRLATLRFAAWATSGGTGSLNGQSFLRS